jgi:putative addiction module component (TIGR02574 family)
VKDLSELLQLPVDQRLQLVEAIRDSLVEVPETVPISDDVREELDRRLAAYYNDPTSARPWREAVARDQGGAVRQEVTLEVIVSRNARSESLSVRTL